MDFVALVDQVLVLLRQRYTGDGEQACADECAQHYFWV